MIAAARLAAMAVAAVLAALAAAQAQNTGATTASVPSIIRVPEPEGPSPIVSPTRIKPEAATPGNGPPLYGASQPLLAPPSPLPFIGSGGVNPCPNGYIQAPGIKLPHTLICVVGQQFANIRASNVAIQNLQTPTLGPMGTPLATSSLPPSLESGGINQCAQRPGYYACGRGGTECCAPGQDNLCFPGAYACSLTGFRSGGPRQACCMMR